jgi:ABC-2 type transport system ATP-binding protein
LQDPVIGLRDVSKRYGHVDALRAVTLDVGAGDIFGLLGPNGAGKTTLIRLLTGSTRATSGNVQVLSGDPKAARHSLGYMPQAAALYEDLSPRDNLRFFGRAHAIPKIETRIDEMLDFAGLRARERDAVHTFSGGMKQRVSLACALMHRPRVLLLDEPTAGVDPRLRAEFWKYFRELARGGTTLLISTHQMDEALLCDRLAVLNEGELIACDTPANLLNRGHTRVHLRHGAETITTSVENYPEALPQLLRSYGLDPAVTRIEIERDTLDEIILRWIQR